CWPRDSSSGDCIVNFLRYSAAFSRTTTERRMKGQNLECIVRNSDASRTHESPLMAVKRHLKGASSKEQRQYEHIKKSAQRSGRNGKPAKEVAARTVMKQHRRKKKK